MLTGALHLDGLADMAMALVAAGHETTCCAFMLTNGLPPREDRLEVVFASDGGETVRMKHHETEQVFATADALSEFLLGPVFTGRPR